MGVSQSSSAYKYSALYCQANIIQEPIAIRRSLSQIFCWLSKPCGLIDFTSLCWSLSKLRAPQGIFDFIRYIFQGLACDRGLAFGKPHFTKLDVGKICKTSFFKSFACAIQWATINCHYFCRSFRTLYDARYLATDACQTKHFANAIFCSQSNSLIGDFTHVSSARTSKQQVRRPTTCT